MNTPKRYKRNFKKRTIASVDWESGTKFGCAISVALQHTARTQRKKLTLAETRNNVKQFSNNWRVLADLVNLQKGSSVAEGTQRCSFANHG